MTNVTGAYCNADTGGDLFQRGMFLNKNVDKSSNLDLSALCVYVANHINEKLDKHGLKVPLTNSNFTCALNRLRFLNALGVNEEIETSIITRMQVGKPTKESASERFQSKYLRILEGYQKDIISLFAGDYNPDTPEQAFLSLWHHFPVRWKADLFWSAAQDANVQPIFQVQDDSEMYFNPSIESMMNFF